MDQDGVRLGQEPGPQAQRDAVHVAIVPAISDVGLGRGQEVGFVDGKAVPVTNGIKSVGIVDPFLPGGGGYSGDVAVYPGVRFWLMLWPGSITSLRHEWSHPAFPLAEGSAAKASEFWLRQFAKSYSIGFEEMVAGAASGDGGCFGDDDGPEAAREPEFWQHMSTYLGRVFSSGHIESTYFRCGC